MNSTAIANLTNKISCNPGIRRSAIDLWVKEYTEKVEAEQRETLAAWMIYNGFATGHGDTTEDLLEELREQIEELRNGS